MPKKDNLRRHTTVVTRGSARNTHHGEKKRKMTKLHPRVSELIRQSQQMVDLPHAKINAVRRDGGRPSVTPTAVVLDHVRPTQNELAALEILKRHVIDLRTSSEATKPRSQRDIDALAGGLAVTGKITFVYHLPSMGPRGDGQSLTTGHVHGYDGCVVERTVSRDGSLLESRRRPVVATTTTQSP